MLFPVARALRRAGLAVAPLGYPSRAPLDAFLDALASRIADAAPPGGRVHIVAHSMGGLVARAALAVRRPATLGRVVMLGTPNAGSEWVGFLRRLRLDGLVLRHATALLAADRAPELEARLGPIDYPVGVIAGSRALDPLLAARILPAPHDGKVSVAATHLAGEIDHIVLPVSLTLMLWDAGVDAQICASCARGGLRDKARL